MNAKAFDRFWAGFLFIMLDFKLNGFDILPDIIGYLFFAAGFSALASAGAWFEKGRRLNVIMIFLSLLYIYDPPVQSEGQLINFGWMGLLGIPVAILGLVIGLLVVYYLFMGIKEMAAAQGMSDLMEDADRHWKQYLYLQLAAYLMIVLAIIPFLAVVGIIVILVISFVIMLQIMRFMKACGARL